MKLKRQEISSKFNGYHVKNNIGTKENLNYYFGEIEKFLSEYDFYSDSNFEFCGRKKFIYDEIIEIINKEEISYETIYFILGSLEEFMCENNHISMGENDSKTFTELRDKNDEYIKTGVICKEEKEHIENLINKIREYLDKNQENNIEETVNKLLNILKGMPSGTETSVTKLLGKGTFYKYTTKQLFEITKQLIKKCEEERIILDYSKYEDTAVGLPFNIDFIKR